MPDVKDNSPSAWLRVPSVHHSQNISNKQKSVNSRDLNASCHDEGS